MKIGYVITSADLQEAQDTNERNEAIKELRIYLQQQGKTEDEIQDLLSFYETFLKSNN